MSKRINKCEGCEKEVKSSRNIVWFKGRNLCNNCKMKAGHQMYIPTSTPSDSTLRELSMEGTTRHLPRKSYKRRISIPSQISLPTQKSSFTNEATASSKVFWNGLSYQEKKLSLNKFIKDGFTEEQALEKVEVIKTEIKKAHQKYKEEIQSIKPNFKEEFDKLRQEGKR